MNHPHTKSELFDFAAKVKIDNPAKLAVLLNDGRIDVWVPRSLLQDNGDGTFTVPEWFAVKNGLV